MYLIVIVEELTVSTTAHAE